MRALYVVSRSLPSAAILIACGQGASPPPAPEPTAVPTAAAAPALSPPPPPAAARAKLYTDQVTLDALPVSLGIETMGGLRTVMLARGTALPATHSEIFSTAFDDQPTVEMHVVEGERALVADNVEIGKVQLVGLPPAKRAIPQIQVTFAVDAHGVLSLSALDLGTKEPREVRVEPGGFGATPLDPTAIGKLLADADAARAADAPRLALANARLHLSNYIAMSRDVTGSLGSVKPPAELRSRLARALSGAQAVLANPDADVTSIDAAFQALQGAVQDATALMYAHATPVR